MSSSDSAGAARGIGRMEAFSDAVFAIAITLPIVEIKVPELGPGGDLSKSLAGMWTEYLAYGLSFLVIGIYWTHHHFTGKIYAKAGHNFNLLNLLFLAAVCFAPFPTRTFTTSLEFPQHLQTAGAAYACALAAPAVGWFLKWLYGLSAGVMDERLDPAYLRRLTVIYGIAAGAHILGAAVSLFDWRIGLAICALVTLCFLRPPPSPQYKPGREPEPEPQEAEG